MHKRSVLARSKCHESEVLAEETPQVQQDSCMENIVEASEWL